MAYDRYDTRGGSRERWRSDDSWRDRDQDQGRREERGFFERAKDEFNSWFGDDDDDRHRRDSMSRGRERDLGREQGRDFGRESGRESGRDWGRGWGASDRPSINRWDRDEERSRSSRDDDDDRGMFGGRGQRSGGGEFGGRRQSMWSDESSGGREQRGYRPMTGDYGRSERDRHDDGQSHWDRDPYRRTSFAGSSERSQHHDPHYSEWRRRQMEELDRDYDDYRREHQSKFESDFGSWRQQRQSKRQMLGQVREHMEVVGSDNEHVGTVDKVAGDRLILTKSDPEAGGQHHWLPCSMFDRIEGDRVILSCKAEEAKRKWHETGRDRPMFDRDERDEGGSVDLERSFSGTYRD